MTDDEIESPPRPPYRRPAVVVLAIVLTGIALAPVVAWNAWLRNAVDPPPLVIPADHDPQLAEALRGARSDTLQQLRSGEAWGAYGELLLASGYRAEARTCFTQAQRFAPGEPRWSYLLGLAVLPDDRDEALIYLRRAAVEADQADPHNPAPSLRLGEVLLAAGKLDNATDALGQARSKAPDDPAVQLALGRLAAARGDAGARSHLEKCLGSPFTRRHAHEALAEIERKQGNAAEADRLAHAAAALPPDQPWPDPYRMGCERKAVRKPARLRELQRLEEQGDYRGAAARLGDVLEKSPDGAAYVAYSRCLLHLADLAGAEQAARTALKLGPEDATAHLALAAVQFAQGEAAANRREAPRKYFEAATESARAATQLQPQSGQARELYGRCLWQMGERDEALDELREGARLSPNRAEAHLYLGKALSEVGQADQARRELAEAARLAGKDKKK